MKVIHLRRIPAFFILKSDKFAHVKNPVYPLLRPLCLSVGNLSVKAWPLGACGSLDRKISNRFSVIKREVRINVRLRAPAYKSGGSLTSLVFLQQFRFQNDLIRGDLLYAQKIKHVGTIVKREHFKR